MLLSLPNISKNGLTNAIIIITVDTTTANMKETTIKYNHKKKIVLKLTISFHDSVVNKVYNSLAFCVGLKNPFKYNNKRIPQITPFSTYHE